MKEISVVGIDLGKNSFHVHGVDARGAVVLKKKLSRAQFAQFVWQLPPCRVGMEACRGSQHWARMFEAAGHDVGVMHPKFVKPYVKTNKNDWRDAEAVCEAVTRPNMTFVPVRTLEQQGVQMLHRARSNAVQARTAKANQLRAMLEEAGVAIGVGLHRLRAQLPERVEQHEAYWPAVLVRLLRSEYEELRRLDARIVEYDKELEALAQSDARCRLLMSIPGIGPLTATALVAKVGRVESFRNARHLAAWLGLVPRQWGTGGRTQLYGISKRGDAYVRTNLIHGARSVLRHARRSTDARVHWAHEVAQRRGYNVGCVALANKIARIAWAVLKSGEPYRAQPVSG